MSDKTIREQYLALRVMRLSRPRFKETVPFPCDPADPCSVGISTSILNTGQETFFPIGSNYIAPHTMREVYVGESFTFYISIINTSVHLCRDISIKADVQTQTRRISVSEMNFGEINLSPNQQVGQIFAHNVQEAGEHILVCVVSYTGPSDEKLNLRKFFKFPVSKPIELIKQEFYDTKNDTIFYEVQCRNLCSTAIFIEAFSLLSCPETFCLSLVSKLLESQEIRQYLFCLTKDKLATNCRDLDLGKLRIKWKTIMGDRGQLELDTMQRIIHGYGNLHMTVERVPKITKINEIFTVDFKLRNSSDRSLDLLVTLNQSHQPSIIHCSISGQRLQTLHSNHSIDISFDFLPYMPGLQQISGICITDLQLKKTYEFDNIVQIFVC